MRHLSSFSGRAARTLPLAALALACSLGGAPAFAQDAAPATPSPADVQKATGAFQEGTKHFQAKKFALALESFQRSYDTVQSPNSLLYIARCQAEIGQHKDAYRTFDKVIAEAEARSATEPKYVPTRDTARLEIQDVANKIALLTIHVQNATPDTRVRIQGGLVASDLLGKPMPFDPGTVEIAVETPGSPPVTQRVDLAVGDKKDIPIDAAPPAPIDAPPPPPPEPKDEGGKMSLLPFAIVAGGIGAVGMGVFAVSGSMSNSTFSELEDTCGSGPCPGNQDEVIDRGQSEQTIANIGLIVGAVGLAAGTALLVVELTGSDAIEAEVGSEPRVALDVGPGWIGAHGSF